ncbi:MAG: amino acid ABC transporter permease [Nocardioides sp.]
MANDRSHQDPSIVIERAGLRERAELASANVPFRVKVALVWIVVIALLAVFFTLANFDVPWMREKFFFIAKGLKYTVIIAVGGIVLAFVLACLGALARISKNPVAYGVAGFYTSFFRGTPLIVQLFLIYLALPQVALNLHTRFPDVFSRDFARFFILDAAVVGILALGLNYGAYMTEIFRAGIQSISGGQSEAADALGMSYGQKMRRVILPQALRVVIPPTGNEFIAMMKDTALISVLGANIQTAELFRRAQFVGQADVKALEAFIVAALVYWALTILLSYFQGKLEARLSRGYDRTAVATKKGKAAPASDPALGGGQH